MSYTQLMQHHLNNLELVIRLAGLISLQLTAVAHKPRPVFGGVKRERME